MRFTLLLALLVCSCATSPKLQPTWSLLGGDYNPTEQWQSSELRQLANQDDPDLRRMMWLINRASSENDNSFLDLLERDDLKQHREIRMSLYGYDYAINRSKEALDKLIEEDSRDPRGGDTTGILVAGYINEWDKTIQMIRSHEKKSDGAGGSALASFWETRRHFYPSEYTKYNKT